MEKLGDRPIDAYSSSDAANYRDWLLDKNLTTSSVKLMFGTIRAVFTLTIQEDGLNCPNAFARTYLAPVEATKRASISPEDIKRIQKIGLDIADERRLLIALISDTGMRLSEALGLVWDDIKLEDKYPHLHLRPHPWRRLKTASSKRVIPLVGASLQAIEILQRQRDSIFLFKTYTNHEGCSSNSCSATLNKWLKSHVPNIVIHSFRHSFRDRLRAKECPSEIIDQLGGWSLRSVGQGYGKGYELSVLSKWMKQI